MNQLMLLKELVHINSSYPQEQELASFLKQYLKDLGFSVSSDKVENNRENILASMGKGQKSILFYCHMDTVVSSSVKQNPRLTGKHFYGLGSLDMKGGIVAVLSAVSRFRPKNITVKLVFSVDEEYISKGAYHIIKYQQEFLSDVALAIVPEPNFGNGLNSLTIGRAGRAIFDISFKGRSAHILDGERAVDAIREMVHFLYEVYKLPVISHAEIGKGIKFIRKVSGGSIDMSIPGEASCQLECIMVPPETVEGVEEVLNALVEKLIKQKKLKIMPYISAIKRETPFLEPYYQNPKDVPFKEILEQIIQKNTGKKTKFYSRVSVGDENVLASSGIPVISWGPDGENAHVDGEYIDIESVDKLSNMFLEFLQKVDK